MTRDEFELLVDILSRDGESYLLFAETEEGLSMSMRFSGEDFFNYIMNLVEIQPELMDVIRSVARKDVRKVRRKQFLN